MNVQNVLMQYLLRRAELRSAENAVSDKAEELLKQLRLEGGADFHAGYVLVGGRLYYLSIDEYGLTVDEHPLLFPPETGDLVEQWQLVLEEAANATREA
jgi:hypothetical protein